MGAGTSPVDPSSVDAEPAGSASGNSAGESARAGGTPDTDATAGARATEESTPDTVSGADAPDAAGEPTGASPVAAAAGRSRRFSLTRDTARPEGGGRAAAGDAPAPARQWPLLTVLCTAGAGLLIVAANAFDEAFRIGAMLMGIALLVGAVLRWVVPSVGMLAVRSRFTDLVTYGIMGTLIVLLALMAQPRPWLDVPILEDVVHFTIR